jgi:hypothetical protein
MDRWRSLKRLQTDRMLNFIKRVIMLSFFSFFPSFSYLEKLEKTAISPNMCHGPKNVQKKN